MAIENQYRPWEQYGETELEYFRRLYLAASERAGAVELALSRLIETGRHLEHSPAFRAAYVEARKLVAPPEAPDALRDFVVVVAARKPAEWGEECPLCRDELQHDARRLLQGDEECATEYRRAVHCLELAALRASRAEAPTGEEKSDGR